MQFSTTFQTASDVFVDFEMFWIRFEFVLVVSMFRSAAKETLAFGHVFGNVSFWQCISQGRSDTNKTATHVDNMLISVSVCGKRA